MVLNNYGYFLVLARSSSITQAAEALNVSHQGLSLYLKNLERELGAPLFERAQKLTLTEAGQAVLKMFSDVEFQERNLRNHIDNILKKERGEFRFGLPEGRFRILMPELLPNFKRRCPDVTLRTRCAPSDVLHDLLLKNELDAALLDQRAADPDAMDLTPMLEERLFLTVSDALLDSLFGDTARARRLLRSGADLAQFAASPFVLNEPGSTSRTAIDSFCASRGVALNCVMELPQLDLHFMLSARGYAASFCWSMYLALVAKLNRQEKNWHLNAFAVKGLDARNRLMWAVRKRRVMPSCGRVLRDLLREACARFADINLNRL